MVRPRVLGFIGLGLGLAAIAVFGMGYSMAKDAGLMGLGIMALGLAGAALLGVGGAVISGVALRRGQERGDKAVAIAGLLVSLAPVLLMAIVMVIAQRGRSDLPEQPLEPPPELQSAAEGP